MTMSEPTSAAARIAIVDDVTRLVRDTTGIQVDRELIEEGLCYPVQEADDDEIRAIQVALQAVVYAATTRPECAREEAR